MYSAPRLVASYWSWDRSCDQPASSTDLPVLAHEPRGQLVQEMLAAVRDLRVDGAHTGLAPGTLGDGERLLVLAVDAGGLDLLARRERDQGFEAEVDADLTGAMLSVLWRLNLQIQVPAAPGILAKAAAENPPADGAAEPEPVPPPEEHHRIVLPSNGTRGLEGDPPEGLSSPPSRPLAAGVPGDHKPLAHRLHGIRVQAEELAAAAGEIDQIEARGPALVVPASGVVDLAAIVPDPVHPLSLSLKMPTGSRILDPIPVREHHGERVIETLEVNNPDAEFSGVFTRFTFRPLSEVEPMRGVMYMCGALTKACHRRSRMRAVRHRSTAARATESAPSPRPERRRFRRGERG